MKTKLAPLVLLGAFALAACAPVPAPAEDPEPLPPAESTSFDSASALRDAVNETPVRCAGEEQEGEFPRSWAESYRCNNSMKVYVLRDEEWVEGYIRSVKRDNPDSWFLTGQNWFVAHDDADKLAELKQFIGGKIRFAEIPEDER